MRSMKVLLVAAVAAGGTLATAAPASAYCDPVIEALTGNCTNAGCIVAGRYNKTANTANATLDELGVHAVRFTNLDCLQ